MTENKKILVVGGSFPLPLMGGSVQYIYNLLSHLKTYSFFVLTSSFSDNNASFDKEGLFHVSRTIYIKQVLDPRHRGIFRRIIDYIFSNILVFIQYWKIKPGIIYLTDYSLLCISLLLIKRFSSTKVVMFTYAEEITQYGKNKVHRLFLKRILKAFDAIITVSDYTLSVIKDIYPIQESKIKKIIPSVSPDKTAPEESIVKTLKSELGLSMGECVFLTVGRLEERKGHKFVLNAVKDLIERGVKVKYLIIGDGPVKSRLENEITRLNLSSNVFLLGRVSDATLAASYRLADIFIMPNVELSNGDTEGCPTVFLEAGFHGLPAIGGNAGGVSDAILHEKTGYIVNPKTGGNMVQVIEELIQNDKLRLQLGENAKKYAAQFTPENQANILMDLNNSLLCK